MLDNNCRKIVPSTATHIPTPNAAAPTSCQITILHIQNTVTNGSENGQRLIEKIRGKA